MAVIKTEIEIVPFTVPGGVIINLPYGGGDVNVKLADLPEETLSELCEQFMAAVFAEAGKSLD